MQDLYFLIKSLSPTEKRYVVLYINRFSSSKTNYTSLYHHIEKLETDDDAELAKKIRKEPYAKHLAVTKHYLFELLLNAMREYYDEHFLEWKLKKQVAQIYVLSSKGLDNAAHRLILKTKKACWQYENFILLLEILFHEKWLCGNRRIALKDNSYGVKVCEEEELAFANYKIFQDYKSIWHRLTYYELTQQDYSLSEYHQLLKNETKKDIMQNNPNSPYYLVQTWYHTVWAHYYMLVEDKRNNFLHYKQVTDIREQQIIKHPDTPLDLFATYYNFLLACYENSEWAIFDTYLLKVKNIKPKSIEQKIKQFHDYYHCLLLYYLGTAQYAKGPEILPTVKDGLDQYQDKIRQDFLIWIWQCAGLICFFNKNYKAAGNWWMQILHLEDSAIEIKIQSTVELYNIMLTVEDESYDVLDYQIKQAEKKLKERKFISEAEKTLLTFFKSVFKNGKPSRKKYEALLQSLIECKNHNNSILIDEFILKWIENKQK